MLTVSIKDSKGNETGKVELKESVFEAPIRPVVMREAATAYLANQRQGTASTKTRAFVSGGGRKPWRQKGTGRARQGSIRSPQWRHGGIAFGPTPRDHSVDMPRQKRRVALRSALSSIASEGRLSVVDGFGLGETPKTKDVIAFLKALGLEGKKVLLVTDAPDGILMRSARNVPGVQVSVVNNLNIYDLLVYDQLVATRPALEKIQETFGS